MTSELSHPGTAGSIRWALRTPGRISPRPTIVLLCGNWSCGILPYCGPGRISDLWKSEVEFIDMFSRYLTSQGFYTLSLVHNEGGNDVPGNEELIQIAGIGGLLTAIRQLKSPVPWKTSQIIGIGHGLGGYILCQLASYGVTPAAFILLSGVFSDYEAVLSQKYLPLIQGGGEWKEGHNGGSGPDPVSMMIAKNLGIVLHAARKGKKKVRIENGDHPIILSLDPMIFIGSQMPRHMFRYVVSPTLIVHGSTDLDHSLWNTASIEQVIRKNGIIPERLIIADRDHWFREVPARPGDQIRERFTGECFKREIDPRIFSETCSFIRKVMNPGKGNQTSPASVRSE